ncbi:hypothetical protein B4O97_03400 [Marispirochaeta aestuarii]|uniref:LamG-like jellyroll fold domain-containing protein n=2 Tax=Marispirochaeta aestuarii TaxID=1963862 RepID=A0A1Y1S167_9SPIO|nr:hypothetical protein B4O97_03400 [Marispirochaeta aestuarii]
MGIQFDAGSSQYIDSSTPVTGYPFTVALSFKLDSLSDGTLFCIANTSQSADWLGYIYFNHGEGNVIEAGARDSVINNVRSTGTIATGVWRRVVIIFEADDTTLRLMGTDGEIEVVSGSNGLTPDNVNQLALGRFNDSSPGSYFDGSLAQLAIWDRVLTPAEADAYLAGVDPQNISTTDLIVHCPFAGDIIDDEGGITLSGTYTLNSGDNPTSGTPDDALKTTEPATPTGRVPLATDVTDDATLALPRYKIIPHQTYPWNIWAVVQATGNDIFFSNDWGATWHPVGDFDFNYHTTVWIDSAGYLHTADRNGAGGITYRKFFASVYLGAHHVSADDAALNPWGAGNTGSCGGMVADGTNLWISDRVVSQSGADLIYVHYSGDNGETFTATYNTGDTFDTEHRVGMVVADGRPALVVYEQRTGGCRFYLYRWDGVDSFDADTDYITTASSDALTRQFGATIDSDGTIHVVWADQVDGTYVIRHAHKTWGNSWSSPVTLATPGTFNSEPAIGYQDDGVVYCLYVNSDGDICRRSYDAGWSAEVIVNDSAPSGHPNVAPVLPSNADYFPVLYTEDDGDSTYTTYVDFIYRTEGGGSGAISGTSEGTSTASGTLTGTGALSGASEGASVLSGVLTGTGSLSGSAYGLATVSAILSGTGSLSGSAAGTCDITALLFGVGSLNGLSEGSCIASGTLHNAAPTGNLQGVAAGSSVVTGTLQAKGALSGLSAGTVTITGTLSGVGALSGQAAGVATLTGTLRDGANIPIGEITIEFTRQGTGIACSVLRTGITASVRGRNLN